MTVSHPPKVFISYAHSTPEHKQRITNLVGLEPAAETPDWLDSMAPVDEAPAQGSGLGVALL